MKPQANEYVEIACVVLDTRNLTLYKMDGSTILIPQGDHRIQRILDAHTSTWNAGNSAFVDLSQDNHYTGVEEKSNGFIKFFKVAKAKVAEFFQSAEAAHVKPVRVGIMPATKVVVSTKGSADKPSEVKFDNSVDPAVTKQEAAVAEIMKHAVPASTTGFIEPVEGGKDTMIAVVDGKVIPGVEKLKPQFVQAGSKLGSTVGVEAFLKRLAAVMDKRRHSVDDLMKFMERGDLPIADDGCIVIYKVLNRARGEGGGYRDVHSSNVPQRVGSRVFMDESMVDPDRRNDCSNGLHVARRGYIKSFGGDVCIIAKVRPEDVIAVPQYDSNKMRVCGYNILAELPPEMFKALKCNEPITGTEAGQKLLGAILAGNHVGITELVKIGGQKGTNITVTQVGTAHADKAKTKQEAPKAHAINPDGKADGAAPVDVKAVAATVAALKAPAETTAPVSKRQVTAQKYYGDMINAQDQTMKVGAAQTLLAYKKTAKVSWEKLGLSDAIGAVVVSVAGEIPAAKPSLFTKAKGPTDVPKVVKPSNRTKNVAMAKGSVEAQPSLVKPVSKPNADLAALYVKATAGDMEAAKALKAAQKAKKKGWLKLGMPANTGEVLAKLLK